MKTEQQHCRLENRKDKQHEQDAAIRNRLNRIKHKILVMSGKGGVGKSSVAAYLSVALAKKGYQVGLMDVDLHGPSIPRLLNLRGNLLPAFAHGKAVPIQYLPNLQVVSIEPLLGEDKDQAVIWRGPLKIGVIRQFISDIEWSDLDYLIIDSPPGTGDEPLTVAQTIPDAQALIVTTPQEISLADVRKSIHFCRQVNMSVLGLVENMNGLCCPHCGKTIDVFKTDGGRLLAEKENLPLLASLPLDPEVARNGDRGSTACLDDAQHPFTQAFIEMVERIANEKRAPSTVTIQDIHTKEISMEKIKFAVPTAGGKLCAHFGHCDQFAILETENGKITNQAFHTPPPHEPGILPQWLHQQGADIIIAGGMGARAQDLFHQNGIKVYTGAPVDTPEALVNQYLTNSLVTGENLCDH